MDREQLLQLEKAAVDVMASANTAQFGWALNRVTASFHFCSTNCPQSPPYAVAEEGRRKAESVFLELRKAKHPYDTCKYILGMKRVWSAALILLAGHTACGFMK